MIQTGTVLNCADNSGAKRLKVIGTVGYSKKRYSQIGEIVTCAVDGTTGIGNYVKDHAKVKVVLIRTKKEIRRKDGTYIRFSDNAGVLINNKNEPIATRVFGPVARDIRDNGFSKIVSLAKEVW